MGSSLSFRGALIPAIALVALVGTSVVVAPTTATAAPSTPRSTRSAGLSRESAEAIASISAVQKGQPVVVDADTTPTTQVSALPDGTMQMVQSTLPVRVKSGSGWVPLDESLTTDSSGRLAPKAADVPVEFGAGGSDVLARVQTKTGKWLDETSPFGVLPTPVVSGATATYPNVLPGVDLQLTATAQGMSEVLVIKSAAAAANPRLHGVNFHVSGSALSSKAGGLATATLPDGSKALSTTPMWWDSSDGSTADGPGGNSSERPVAQATDASSISLDAQAAATTAGVQYPVYVDPDWTGGLQAYTYVDAAYTTTSYWDGANATGQQRTGYIAASYSPDNRNHKARSLWQVDTTGVEGKHILNAVFSVTEDWSFNCTPSEVDLYWSGGISPSTTWNNQPGLIQYLSNAVVAHGNNSGCPTAAVGFGATAGVQAAANINATGLTLELRAANEASNSSWKRFTQAATITINYNTPPNNPSAAIYTSPSRSCSTSSTAPTYLDGTQAIGLGVTATDADAGQNVNTVFYVYNSSGAQVWTGPYPTSAQGARSVTIPANTLATGAYSWNARNGDLIDLSPGFSTTCYFYIATVAPAAPGVTQTSTGAAVVGQPITVSFTSALADQVQRFAYWWAPGSATTPGPQPPATTAVVPGGALPACGSTSGAVTYVCPDSSGTASGITVAPVDDLSTLWAVSYNAAARVSVDSSDNYAATGLTVTANPDTTDVSFKSGHEWNFDTLSLPVQWGTDLTDSNENPTDDFNSDWTANKTVQFYANTATSEVYGPPPSPVLEFLGYTDIRSWGSPNSYTDPANATYETLEEDQVPPTGWNPDENLGILQYSGPSAPPGAETLYSCALAAGGEMTTVSSVCDGNAGTATPLGYSYLSESAVDADNPVGGFQMWRCQLGTKYRLSIDVDGVPQIGDSCGSGGWLYQAPLGWAAVINENPTPDGVVDSSKSFSANAWINPGAMVGGRTYTVFEQTTTDAQSWGYVLRVNASGHLEFCVRAQAVPMTTDCASDPSPIAQGTWVMATGIWDATNHQVRLLVGDSTVAAGTVSHIPPSGDSTAGGSFNLGSTFEFGGPLYGEWNGMIANPAVFPGVIDSNELFDLYTDQPLPDPAP